MRMTRDNWLTAGAVVVFFLIIWWSQSNLNAYYQRVLNTGLIYVVAAVGYNLINGVTGQFSLGPNGFMAIGGYTVALLVLPVMQKQMTWFLQPLIWPLNSITFPPYLFVLTVVIGGVLAAVGGFLVGYPSLRLKGDYLAIATFGFGEIIFVICNNLIPITNGALGIKGIPEYTNLWWTGFWAVVSIVLVRNLVNSSFGRAMKAIRENEIAAEAMGINVFYHKMLAFIVCAFLCGISGGLLATLITTISPTLFMFMMTFNLLIIIVLGGLGSLTGTVVTAMGFAVLQELLRAVEKPVDLGFVTIPGISGMRMVIFALLLIFLMIFRRQGLLGQAEFSWEWLISKFGGGAKEWPDQTASQS